MMRGKKHSKLHKNTKKIKITKKCKKIAQNAKNCPKNCHFPKKLPKIAAAIFRRDSPEPLVVCACPAN